MNAKKSPVPDPNDDNKIKLHEKAFAHLTRGMYRSPASAIRELVSNAWDAGAENVHIRTGYPHFVEMSIVDDGDGFDEEEFKRIVSGGLGNSEKRSRTSSRPDRPTIGRLGIGMFGIAQICGAFIIASKPRDGRPFKARIRLYNLLKEKLDEPNSDVIVEKTTTENEPIQEIHIGEFEMLPFDPEEFDGTGTRIVADVMHPVFTRTFTEAATTYDDGVPAREWSAVLAQAKKHHSLQEMGDYFRFFWEIAASTPIPYVSVNAVPDGRIKQFQAQLLAADFHVFIDGREIFKPIFLTGNKNGYTTIPIPQTEGTPYSRRVSFSGYLAVQEGLQIRPDELRGILIRVKGVGIGLYDPSLLDYRFNEGPRSRWITGEVYVTEGLEDALNVDRDSFNRFHPQYKYLQQVVHQLLRKKLMPMVYAELSKRSSNKADSRKAARRDALASALEETFSAKTKPISSSDAAPVLVVQAATVNKVKTKVSVATEDEETIGTKKTNRQLASSIMAIFDLAALERSTIRRREAFREALLKLLRDW